MSNEKTPAAHWRERGEPDPFQSYSKLSRHELMCGDFTDDELANAVFMSPNIVNTTGAKERIRWLSRKLTDDPRLSDDPLTALKAVMEKHDICFSMFGELEIFAANKELLQFECIEDFDSANINLGEKNE